MSKSLQSPHDILLKDLLQNKSEAIAFFEHFLDSKILALLDLQTLESQNTTYISSKLKTNFSDFVFSVKIKNADNLYLSILVENKSAPDKYTSLQILRYISEAYEKQLKENKKLELIIPVLFYHGKETWKLKSLKDLLNNYPKSLNTFIPDFDIFKIFLKTYKQDELVKIKQDYLASCMLLLNADTKLKSINALREIVKRHENFGDGEQILKIIRYFYNVSEVKIDNIQEIIDELPPNINKKAMTIYEQIIERGIEKGIEKGIERGIEKRNIDTIINSYKNNLSTSLISIITGLNESNVIEILKKNGLM